MNDIWHGSYPQKVPLTVDADAYPSIAALFEDSCNRFANRVAVRSLGGSLTYAGLGRLSNHFAAYLQSDLELKPGQRIAIMLPNIMQYPVALFGALRAGLVVVNVNPLYTARELSHQLRDSGAKTIVVAANFAHVVAKVTSSCHLANVIVTELGDVLPPWRRTLVNFAVRRIKKLVPAWSIPRAVTWRRALAKGSALAFRSVDVKGSDPAFLQYTGGTTGVARGAVLTHRNVVANLEQVAAWFGPWASANDTIVTPLPLYHIFALGSHEPCGYGD